MIQKFKNLVRPKDRHNLVLRVAGTYFFVTGMSMHFYVPEGPRWDALVVARAWMPLHYWGYVFMAVGIVVILSAIRSHSKSPGGYAAMTGMASGWSAFLLLGTFINDDPETNLTLGIGWALQAFLWWGISGLLNPDPYQHRERRTDEHVSERNSKLDET